MAPNPAIPHLAIVSEVRQAFQSLPASPERAWRMTNDVALRLQAQSEDAGLFAKTSGTNFNGYSLDRICYRTGELFDIWFDGEGEARPQWNYDGQVDPGLWRAPVLIEHPEEPPTPPTPEPPLPLDEVLLRLEQIVTRLDRLILGQEAQTQVQHEIRRTVESPLQVVQPVKVKFQF